ncbi:SDR family NAD(P)-dependent oxidoreductase [Croceibacterium sp. TMG7-5b_MA50]|uniref:SDR family NAD(P)-dependent oxidoreductase n=1 Tax=Croceibacterium sp. TMG7-5b_MA50 TaxID=3121290 RepID=UPI003221AEFF
MAGSLDGRIAYVTGSSRGIGAATAQALAAEGAHVLLSGRTISDLEAVEDAIHQAGGTATIAPFDLTEADAVSRLAGAVAERWDRLDILVLNAAILPQLTPVAQIEGKAFNQALLTNLLAPQALLAAFDPLLRRSPAGRVIGLTSSVATSPRAYWGAYAASKAALEVLLDTYAQEVERISGTRVAIVDPGATRTKMRARAFPGEDPQGVKPPEAVAACIAALLAADFPNRHRERVET